MRARGYAAFACSEPQDRLLDKILAEAGPGKVGVFDLDGCLFDTRVRQVTIFREFASRHGQWKLYDVEPKHFISWDLRDPLQGIGLVEEDYAEFYEELKTFWASCFFSSEYVRMDQAMPGATDLIRRCHDAGMFIVYLTGRDHTMRAGTEAGLVANGFPYGVERSQLFTKPDFAMDDTIYKADALVQIAKIGEPVVFMDNEPSNVNAFSDAFPNALHVFVETDHSPKPVTPYEQIPWIRSFFRSSWHGGDWSAHRELPNSANRSR
jgi:hypothetical protein